MANPSPYFNCTISSIHQSLNVQISSVKAKTHHEQWYQNKATHHYLPSEPICHGHSYSQAVLIIFQLTNSF